MKIQDIQSKKNSILQAIKQRRLSAAFRRLRSFSEQQMTWEITDEISRIEESYRYMLDYAMRGVSDPSRDSVYDKIVVSMLTLLDKLERHALSGESPTLYYNTLRYINQSARDSITTLVRKYDEQLSNGNVFPGTAVGGDYEYRRRLESIERDLFNKLWTAMPLTNEDYETLCAILKSDRYYTRLKQFVLSGLLLGMLEFHDDRRLMLMIDAYESGNDAVASIAVITLLLSLYMYRDRMPDAKVAARLKLLEDSPAWHTDLRDAFLELVRARDTERITRTMRDEVVPEMLKLRPELKKRFDDIANNLEMIDENDINPEWQEMLEKSGIADKMKKLFEIQLEGGDVFMSTFSHMKSFPFFNELSNWFLPFHSERSEMQLVPAELADIIPILENSPIFCNSDKYSFILSLQGIPAPQREMMKGQLNTQVNGMMELQSASLDNRSKRRGGIMNRYVQDLYRFFKLFRRKGEFKDPFVTDLNMVTVPSISRHFNDVESLQAIAEFYFKHEYYHDSLNLFKAIEALSCPDIQLFQKIGYCYEKTLDYRKALDYYEQSELLDADSLWTMRHKALCHRMLGEPGKALECYRRMIDEKGDSSINTVMAMGDCLMELEDFEKASQQYYKINYLDGNNTRANRQLAWCQMMMRNLDKAKQLYDTILNGDVRAEDYLNMGHLSLAMADDNNALNFYKLYISQVGCTLDDFATKLTGESIAFRHMGLDEKIIPLIVDAISYSERGNSDGQS